MKLKNYMKFLKIKKYWLIYLAFGFLLGNLLISGEVNMVSRIVPVVLLVLYLTQDLYYMMMK